MTYRRENASSDFLLLQSCSVILIQRSGFKRRESLWYLRQKAAFFLFVKLQQTADLSLWNHSPNNHLMVSAPNKHFWVFESSVLFGRNVCGWWCWLPMFAVWNSRCISLSPEINLLRKSQNTEPEGEENHRKGKRSRLRVDERFLMCFIRAAEAAGIHYDSDDLHSVPRLRPPRGSGLLWLSAS